MTRRQSLEIKRVEDLRAQLRKGFGSHALASATPPWERPEWRDRRLLPIGWRRPCG